MVTNIYRLSREDRTLLSGAIWLRFESEWKANKKNTDRYRVFWPAQRAENSWATLLLENAVSLSRTPRLQIRIYPQIQQRDSIWLCLQMLSMFAVTAWNISFHRRANALLLIYVSRLSTPCFAFSPWHQPFNGLPT